MTLFQRIMDFFVGSSAEEVICGTFMDIENVTKTADRLRVPPPSKV